MGVHGKQHIYVAVWLVFPFVVFFLACVERQWLECILSCVVCFSMAGFLQVFVVEAQPL